MAISHVSWHTISRRLPGTIVSRCRCKALALGDIDLSRIGRGVVGAGTDSVEPATLPSPRLLEEALLSFLVACRRSFFRFAFVTFQVQDRNWDAIWPRRCHSEHASSLACPALADEANTAGLTEKCQQPKSLFGAWSHDGPLVVGVDGI